MFEYSDHADMHLDALEPQHLRSECMDVLVLLLFLLPLDAECDVMNVKEKGGQLVKRNHLGSILNPPP